MFSCIPTHGTAPRDMVISRVIHIPKGRNANITNADNYRGIALSAILGKLLDLIVLVRYGDLLCSSDLQFGFKRGRSTSMCTLILKVTIEYYVHNSSSVYYTLLDATKAFDRV